MRTVPATNVTEMGYVLALVIHEMHGLAGVWPPFCIFCNAIICIAVFLSNTETVCSFNWPVRVCVCFLTVWWRSKSAACQEMVQGVAEWPIGHPQAWSHRSTQHIRDTIEGLIAECGGVIGLGRWSNAWEGGCQLRGNKEGEMVVVSGCECKSPIFRRMGYYFLRDD
jgi:hypothetical protein